MKRKKKVLTIMENEEGFSLVELLVSIVILAIIVGAFMSMFVYATKTNITTEKVVETGYIAQTCMEEVYTLSISKDTAGIVNALDVEQGYDYTNSGDTHVFTKEIDGYYVKIEMKRKSHLELTDSDELTTVIVKVYHDSAYSNLAASVQNIINVHDPA